MQFDWVISVPVWGDRCVNAFLQVGLPAIKSALGERRPKFVVHTDQPTLMATALASYPHEIKPVPAGRGVHQSAGAGNREALALAPIGSCVAFINADMVPSVEVFAAAEQRFEQGKKVIMMAASRTIGAVPPIGAASRELLHWTMEHRHPAIIECFFGTGRSTIPWAIYFKRGDDIVLHGFHLHPFAVVKRDAKTTFHGVSIDSDLMDAFQREEVHLVTDADEASFAEMSPPERVFGLMSEPFKVEHVASWASVRTTPLQRWLFTLPITIVGSGNARQLPICEDISRRLRLYKPSGPPKWRRLLNQIPVR